MSGSKRALQAIQSTNREEILEIGREFLQEAQDEWLSWASTNRKEQMPPSRTGELVHDMAQLAVIIACRYPRHPESYNLGRDLLFMIETLTEGSIVIASQRGIPLHLSRADKKDPVIPWSREGKRVRVTSDNILAADHPVRENRGREGVVVSDPMTDDLDHVEVRLDGSEEVLKFRLDDLEILEPAEATSK